MSELRGADQNSGAHLAPTRRAAQSKSIRSIARLACRSPRTGCSKSASSALRYSVDNMVFAGPLRSTETLPFTRESMRSGFARGDHRSSGAAGTLRGR